MGITRAAGTFPWGSNKWDTQMVLLSPERQSSLPELNSGALDLVESGFDYRTEAEGGYLPLQSRKCLEFCMELL